VLQVAFPVSKHDDTYTTCKILRVLALLDLSLTHEHALSFIKAHREIL